MAPRQLLPVFLLSLATCGLSGCLTTQPLVSHAHIGHAMTTWHDTPGKAGLLATAEQQADVAWQAVNRGCRSQDSDAAGEALQRALLALSPEIYSPNQAGDYGAIRALAGAIDHIEFAAASEDASINMVTSVAELAAQGSELVEYLLQIALSLRTQLNEGRVRCRALITDLEHGLDGFAGEAASGIRVLGIRQFRTQLQAMLARETNPPYEPVSRRYVLGLVRLPNGKWNFRLGPPPGRRSDIGGYAFGSGY